MNQNIYRFFRQSQKRREIIKGWFKEGKIDKNYSGGRK